MSDWQWSGARWWKFDLHAHTPASDDYGKGSKQADLRQITPQEWLLSYMRAGIDCVAVTDHNSGSWIDLLKDALKTIQDEQHPEYRPLYLFPGMEISVHGGIHLLAIFGPEKTSADLDFLRGAVQYQGAPGQNNGVTGITFNEVVEKIVDSGGIAIPAHVDDHNGLFQASGITLGQYLQCPHIFAIEVVDSQAQKHQQYLDAKKGWSEILGSDSHHPAGQPGQRYPGSHFTWVKMGKPSIEGLRLALQDGSPLSLRRSDDPDADDPNRHAENVIESLEVAEAYYLGRGVPFTVTFNPWLNAIIGGRGTGKSTIIEFLRLTLRRREELPSEFAEEFKKYWKVGALRGDGGLLTDNTQLTIVYRKADVRYRIRWDQKGILPAIEEEVQGGWRESVGEIRQRFPVRIYSQKQIFHLAKNPLAILEMIDEALGASFHSWQEESSREEKRYLTLCARVREIEQSLAEEARILGELEDVKHKLSFYEKTSYTDILKTYQRLKRQEQEIHRWEESWRHLGDRLRQFVADAIPEPLEAKLFTGDPTRDEEILSQARQTHEQLQERLAELEAQADRIDRIYEAWSAWKRQSGWYHALQRSQQEYHDLIGTLTAEGISDPGAYGELIQRRQVLEQKIKEIESRKQEAQKLKKEAQKTSERILDLRRGLTAKRRKFLDGILQNNPFVRIVVVPYGAKQTVEEEFRQIIHKEDGSFQKDIGSPDTGEGLLGQLYQGSTEPEEMERKVADLKNNIRKIIAQPEEATIQDRRFPGYLKNLPPESLDRLDLWFPRDSLEVSYSPTGDGRDFQSIEQGSPGQKTAALLAFFLSYGDEPLILDQPEDDLDNHLIYKLIVQQLRQLKRRRQLIVVTHNANIVVNGDAEFVLGLKVANGQTYPECAGSLQEKQVRETICNVMEGGVEAFQKRYNRIALEVARV